MLIIQLIENRQKTFYKNIIANHVNTVSDQAEAFKFTNPDKAEKVRDLVAFKKSGAEVNVMTVE